MALTISARNLAAYAADRFCARCAWVRLHVKPLPYQTFPGIFSSIDRFNKLIVHSHFDREGRPPSWLRELGETETYLDPPHWSKFSIVDQRTGVTLRGEADGIFKMADGSYTIVDYKTARYTPGQEAMLPMYEAQLNAYAYIGERQELRPIGRLALVYMEPLTQESIADKPEMVDELGFSMGFKATIVPVHRRPDGMIPPLLDSAKAMDELQEPPAGRQGCRDCRAVEDLVSALNR